MSGLVSGCAGTRAGASGVQHPVDFTMLGSPLPLSRVRVGRGQGGGASLGGEVISMHSVLTGGAKWFSLE